MEISSGPLNIENAESISDLILMNSNDANLDTFTTLPIDFDTSDSSVETIESVEETINVESNIPMLTDIAEETIYETEFFDENVRSEPDKCQTSSKLRQTDICNIPIDVIKSDDSVIEINDETQLNELSKSSSGMSDESDSKSTFVLHNEEISCDGSSSNNEEHIYVTLSSDNCTTETTNTVTFADAKDTSKSTNLIENITIDNLTSVDSTSDTVEVVLGNSKPNNTSNLFNVNSGMRKVPTLAPLSVQNTSKFVPINIAPNSLKRPAAISIGQPSPNVIIYDMIKRNSTGN